MTKYQATLATRLEHTKTDDLVFIEGTLIEPGEYQGIDGNKVYYSNDVLADGASSAKGRPVLFRHTEDDGEEKDLVVGFTSSYKEEDGNIGYKAVIYNDRAFPYIEDGTFNAVSPEIDVDGKYDSDAGRFVAEKIGFSSIVLTNDELKGISGASIERHGTVHISLEKKEGKNLVDKVKYEDMTEEEKLVLARELLEGKGMTITDKPEEEEEEEEEKEEPEETPVGVPKEVTDLMERVDAQASQLAYFQNKELVVVEAEIQEIDDEFKMADVTEGVDGFDAQKSKLEKHRDSLLRLLPKIRLELAAGPTQVVVKLEEQRKVALEMYGSMEEAKEFAPQLWPEEGE